jgi:hypothetical protein
LTPSSSFVKQIAFADLIIIANNLVKDLTSNKLKKKL